MIAQRPDVLKRRRTIMLRILELGTASLCEVTPAQLGTTEYRTAAQDIQQLHWRGIIEAAPVKLVRGRHRDAWRLTERGREALDEVRA